WIWADSDLKLRVYSSASIAANSLLAVVVFELTLGLLNYCCSVLGLSFFSKCTLKPTINPKRERKANRGTGNTSACNNKKPNPTAKDSKAEIINLLVRFKINPQIKPKKRVAP
ncbi:MAG TPA: hypothetical protein PLG08_11055, partial [Chitinophagaceae bacterium]|nr:hypothetical protein [Chitinophagaceae bacterium]